MIGVRLDSADLDRLDRAAERKGVPRAAAARAAIARWLDELDRQEQRPA